MFDILDEFDEFLEKRKQKKELERRIKDDLEADEKFYKKYLERCNHIESLSEEHIKLKDALEDCFDGQANKALRQRLEENILLLKGIEHSYVILRESIRVRGGWWS